MLKFLSSNHDRDEWDRVVNHPDPHFSSAYYRAFGGGLLAVQDNGGVLSMQPFRYQEKNWVGNVYNFGGPLGEWNMAARFAYEFDDWKSHHNLNERCTLNPFIHQDMSLAFRHLETSEIVYVDLEAELKLRPTTRRCITNAKNDGVTTRQVEPSVANCAAFEDIYFSAMRAKSAASHWFYPPGFFHDVLHELGPDRSALFFTDVGTNRESGCLIINDKETCYYHWAAKYGYRSQGSDHLQIASILEWARNAGMRRVCLGGGVTPNDGVFKFKAGFSDLRLPCRRYVTMSGVSQ